MDKSSNIKVTIAQDESLSGVVDIQHYALVGIIMPDAWTAANLTFQAAKDNILATDEGSGGAAADYQDLYDDGGTEVNVSAAAGRAIGVTAAKGEALAPFRYIKVRSGTTGTPVAQEAARTLYLVVKG